MTWLGGWAGVKPSLKKNAYSCHKPVTEFLQCAHLHWTFQRSWHPQYQFCILLSPECGAESSVKRVKAGVGGRDLVSWCMGFGFFYTPLLVIAVFLFCFTLISSATWSACVDSSTTLFCDDLPTFMGLCHWIKILYGSFFLRWISISMCHGWLKQGRKGAEEIGKGGESSLGCEWELKKQFQMCVDRWYWEGQRSTSERIQQQMFSSPHVYTPGLVYSNLQQQQQQQKKNLNKDNSNLRTSSEVSTSLVKLGV